MGICASNAKRGCKVDTDTKWLAAMMGVLDIALVLVLLALLVVNS